MKNTLVYLLVCINLIFLVSCKENKIVKPAVNDPLEGNTYPLVVKDEFGFSWPESLVVDDIIYLQTDIDLLIVSVSKLMISPSGDRYYIHDGRQSKMFGFDGQGNNISVFSKLGTGPGEYKEIKDTQIDFENDQFEILDYDEIKKFNLIDFEYLGSISLRGVKGNNIYGNFVNIEGVYYLFTTLPPVHRLVPSARANPHEFHLLRKDGDQHDFFIPKKYGILGMEGDPRFRQSHILGEYNLTPILGSNEIIGINKEGIFNKYHFPFASNGVPVIELLNFYDREGEFLRTDYYKFLNNIMETERHLLFNFIGSLVQYHVLFDKSINKIVSIGRSKEYMPEMISSDSKYFYCYVQPASLLKHIEEGNSFENHPILKSIDFEKIDREDNPILIKFHLE
ncbi:6-bladed beta-propeller [Aquiflexum lacus]|uniref:6-bladed beta-propeller n=1 Tax=Aquiflexum lacus TaxID=2483805 RepID=UPI001893C7DF|nr:6-bladed beta-propeller [Aquiflexum lacus]